MLKDILPLAAVTPVTIALAVFLLGVTARLFWQWWHGKLDDLLLLAWCGFVVYALHPHGKSYEHITLPAAAVGVGCQTKDDPLLAGADFLGRQLPGLVGGFFHLHPTGRAGKRHGMAADLWGGLAGLADVPVSAAYP